MGTVIQFPTAPRSLNAIREIVKERAKVRGVSDDVRLRACMKAWEALKTGGSTAWATQAAIQELGNTRPRLGLFGGHVA